MATFLLCIKIFLVRIVDVSLGTIRTIVTVKDKKLQASIIGFFEVLVWFLIVKEALNTDNTSIWIAIFYALGFATGTYIGTYLSNKYIKGNFGIQVITSSRDKNLVNIIRNEGYAVTVIDIKGHDKSKRKYMLFIEIDKNRFNHLQNVIKKLDPKAFIVVNETKYVQNGYFNK
jgi:uncharacterized protein YebE (UPF0316 family)